VPGLEPLREKETRVPDDGRAGACLAMAQVARSASRDPQCQVAGSRLLAGRRAARVAGRGAGCGCRRRGGIQAAWATGGPAARASRMRFASRACRDSNAPSTRRASRTSRTATRAAGGSRGSSAASAASSSSHASARVVPQMAAAAICPNDPAIRCGAQSPSRGGRGGHQTQRRRLEPRDDVLRIDPRPRRAWLDDVQLGARSSVRESLHV
jgi:hypothetical protein